MNNRPLKLVGSIAVFGLAFLMAQAPQVQAGQDVPVRVRVKAASARQAGEAVKAAQKSDQLLAIYAIPDSYPSASCPKVCAASVEKAKKTEAMVNSKTSAGRIIVFHKDAMPEPLAGLITSRYGARVYFTDSNLKVIGKAEAGDPESVRRVYAGVNKVAQWKSQARGRIAVALRVGGRGNIAAALADLKKVAEEDGKIAAMVARNWAPDKDNKDDADEKPGPGIFFPNLVDESLATIVKECEDRVAQARKLLEEGKRIEARTALGMLPKDTSDLPVVKAAVELAAKAQQSASAE